MSDREEVSYQELCTAHGFCVMKINPIKPSRKTIFYRGTTTDDATSIQITNKYNKNRDDNNNRHTHQ